MNSSTLGGPIAGAAMTSPWWLPVVHTVSDGAALVLPILGAIWMIMQITTKIIEIRRKRRSVKAQSK